MTMGVTNTNNGTMPESEGRNKISPEDKGKTPAESKVSPESEQLVYTQRQTDMLLHATKSESGRKVAELEAQLQSTKQALATRESELAANADEIKRLDTKLEDLASDDPRRFDVVKELRAAREERVLMRDTVSKLSSREQALVEREKKANTFDLEVLAETIATEYEGGEFSRLKAILSKLDSPNEQLIREIADTLWTKKPEGAQITTPTIPTPYSNKTEGGGSTEEQRLKRRYPTM